MIANRREQSALGPVIASYLELHRALGRTFRNEDNILAGLDRFLAVRGTEALTATEFDAWTRTLAHLSATVRRNHLRVVRNLCLYQRRTAPDCFVPDPRGFPARSAPQRPFIFSEVQILALLREADRLSPATVSPLRPAVYRLALVLLWTTGLRRRELVRLAIGDYDECQRTLLVRASKFFKSRHVPLSDSAVVEVERYLKQRRLLPYAPDAPLLANGHGDRQAYCAAGLAQGLRKLFRAAGIQTDSGDLPRTHDLRHSYAHHVLLGWYRAGRDPRAGLPRLAAAMGHASVASTAIYLRCLEPVAEAASERFARHAAAVLGATKGGSRA